MLFTIKDIENISGIKAHTIRIWEQRYSFLKPNRSDTNIRYYSIDQLRTILNVSLLSKYGYKISQINKMSPQLIFENVFSLTDTEAKQDLTITELLQAMLELDAERFEIILNDCITASGIEKTVLQIIFPFLDKVGMLWLTNRINSVLEKLVSNVIRQKIITGIDLLPKAKSTIKVCLFLPEAEFHELSLLFIVYLLKKNDVRVIYLGANILLSELKDIVEAKKPDYLFTHFTSAGCGFETFLNHLNKELRDLKIVVSGYNTILSVKKIPPKVILVKSLIDVEDYIIRNLI